MGISFVRNQSALAVPIKNTNHHQVTANKNKTKKESVNKRDLTNKNKKILKLLGYKLQK